MNAYTTAQFGQPVMPHGRTGGPIIADVFGQPNPSVHLEAALAKAWAALSRREGHRKGVPSDTAHFRMHTLSRACVDKVLAYIRANPGASNYDVRMSLRMGRSTAAAATRALCDEGSIIKSKNVNTLVWRVVK